MKNFDDIDFITEMSKQLINIKQFVEGNLKNIDEEGFAFLTNIKKGDSLPIAFALRFGFKNPVFKIKEAKKNKEIEDYDYDILCCKFEGAWVKEGLE